VQNTRHAAVNPTLKGLLPRMHGLTRQLSSLSLGQASLNMANTISFGVSSLQHLQATTSARLPRQTMAWRWWLALLLEFWSLATLWALLRQQPRAGHLVYAGAAGDFWASFAPCDCIPARYPTCATCPVFSALFIFELLYGGWTWRGGRGIRACLSSRQFGSYEVESA